MASVTHFKKAGCLALTTACLVFAMFAPAQSAAAGDSPKVTRAAAPGWVKPQPVDISLPADNDQVGNGVWDLLVDEQTNVRESSFYKHYASKYLSENGVQESSRITINFDPAYETLTLNKLVVYRDGKPVDRLKTQEIKLLQREEGLDRQLYDGRLSAVMLMEDIRVGDIIEYAYTLHGMNPIFAGNYFDAFYAQWDTPLHHLYQRLLWPSQRKLSIKSYVKDFPPKVITSGTPPTTEYVWEKNDVPPLISDGDLPPWYEPYQWVQFSEFPTWGDVNNWALKFLSEPDKVPDSLREQIDLLRPISDPKAKAIAALRLVQKNIRYLGIEVGAHSHKPYPIATVWQRRFGDCKDKARLLCAVLRQLGLEAYPSLVDTDLRESLTEWLPTPIAFNHMVVQLRLDGRNYWLDPTRSDQGGGLDELYFPPYGESLVVKEGTDSLTKINPGGMDVLNTEVTESYALTDFNGDATLKVHSIFRGRNAESTRAWLAETSHAEIQKSYLNFYAKQHQYIQVVKPPVFTDDFEKNVIICDESYTISHLWQPTTDNPDRLYADFDPQSLRDLIAKPNTQLRTMPMDVEYPERISQTITISLPEGMKLTSEQFNIDDRVFKFTYKRTFDKNLLTLHYTYESLQDHVDTDRVPEYLKNTNKILDNLEYEIRHNTNDAIATVSTPAPVSPPADVKTFSPIAMPSPQPPVFGLQALLVLSPYIFLVAFFFYFTFRKRFRPIAAELPEPSALHRCAHCGKTEFSSPDAEFRVARNGEEYCSQHLPKSI